jgi:siroheme synthase
VMGAATDKAWRWIGTLAELGAVEIPAASADAPGMLVIGEVVSLADRIGAGATVSEQASG